jgi:bacterioferritin-associated ferredoxin
VIICSCNVLSDGQVRSAIATAVSSAQMRGVYASLGCVAKCGRCAHTIKIILQDTFASPAPSISNVVMKSQRIGRNGRE